jgi:hypothetical protein
MSGYGDEKSLHHVRAFLFATAHSIGVTMNLALSVRVVSRVIVELKALVPLLMMSRLRQRR